MSTSLARSWPRAEPARTALVVAAAWILFAASWAAGHRGAWADGQLVDTPVYQGYGERMVAGQVPYRDFSLEYPPGALPAFVLPSLGADTRSIADYRERFELLMFGCGCLMLACMAVALVGLGAGTVRLAAALGFAALLPILLGPLIQTRFDLLPAALVAGAIAALVWNRPRLGLVLLTLGATVKVYPALLLPLALAYVWRRRGRREALVCGGLGAAAAACVAVPFLLLSPGGLWDTVESQLDRPLQVESLGAALLVSAHNFAGASVAMAESHGSQNLAGGTADAFAAIQSALLVVLLLAAWIAFARRRRSRDELIVWSAGAVTLAVALGKVLSPQFLIWLVPLVPLVRGRRGLIASVTLGAAMLLTQAWFPDRYVAYAFRFDGLPTAFVLARDLLLVGLAALLLWPERRRLATD